MRDEILKEKSREYFDKVAQREEIIPEPLLCYDAVISRMEFKEGLRITDVGCGTGAMLGKILEACPFKADLYGLDISPESLKAAKRLLGNHAGLTEGDSEKLPYDDESSDIVLCMHSLHHYPKPVKCLSEMHRILRPDGVLFLVENDYPLHKRIIYNTRFRLTSYYGGDIRMYSEREMRKMVIKAGFADTVPERIADHSQLLVCRKVNKNS